MSADLLRRAATLMRERAEAATPGPWEPFVLGSEGYDVRAEAPVTDDYDGRPLKRRPRVARCGYEEWETDKANAVHIASWHPAVALAVADWLDLTAADLAWYVDFGERLKERARATGQPEPEGDPERDRNVQAALAVARAYLGEVAP